MKKRIISIITFLVLFIVSFIYLNKVFITPNNFINSTEDFKELAKKTNIDVLFYGSSHVYTAYNPLVINEKCNTVSFNLGSDSQLLKLTDLVLEESLKYTSPKLLVLEVYNGTLNMSLTKAVKGHQLRALYFVSNYSKNKLQKIYSIYNNTEILDVYSPLFRNHSKWNKKKYSDLKRRTLFKKNEAYYYQGYLGFLDVIREQGNKFKKFKEVKTNTDTTITYFKKNQKKNIINFVTQAKKKEIKVLMVTSPDIRLPYSNYHLYDELKTFCDSLEISYLNLNNHYTEMDLLMSDFRDPAHLNMYGSTKASAFLSNYINKKFSLPNRSSDDIWISNNNKYKDFMNRYYSKVDGVFFKPLKLKMTDALIANDIKISRKNNTYSFTLNFEDFNDLLNGYKLEIQLYPQEYYFDSRSEKSILKGWKFDKKTHSLLNETQNIKFDFETNIKHLRKIKIFLYKPGKRGIIGIPIILEDIIFN